MKFKPYYLLNYPFIIALVFLILNDHVFKLQFSNWVTGKLSDVLGVFLLPVVLTYIFPKLLKFNIVFTALFFVFWKLEYSQPFIDAYNQIALIQITRVVDYTDIVALLVLPLAYYFIKHIETLKQFHISATIVNPFVIVFVSCFAFMATSPPHYYFLPENVLTCLECKLKTKKNKDDILKTFKAHNFNVKLDSFPNIYDDTTNVYNLHYREKTFSNIEDEYPFYIIDSLIIDNDTILDARFAVLKNKKGITEITFNNMRFNKPMSSYKARKKMMSYYKRLYKSYFKQKFKD